MKKMTVFERTIRETPINKVDWEKVSRHVESQDVSFSFIREYADYLDWDKISLYKHTKEFYREFADRLKWWRVAISGIQERKIKEFKDKFEDHYDWNEISKNSFLSKKFIMRNTELIDWDEIFWFFTEDEKFLTDNRNRFSNDVDIEICLGHMGVKREED